MKGLLLSNIRSRSPMKMWSIHTSVVINHHVVIHHWPISFTAIDQGYFFNIHVHICSCLPNHVKSRLWLIVWNFLVIRIWEKCPGESRFANGLALKGVFVLLDDEMNTTNRLWPYQMVTQCLNPYSIAFPTTKDIWSVPLGMKQCGFVLHKGIQKTSNATTQIVPSAEAETRDIVRDHSHVWHHHLKVRHASNFLSTPFSWPRCLSEALPARTYSNFVVNAEVWIIKVYIRCTVNPRAQQLHHLPSPKVVLQLQ